VSELISLDGLLRQGAEIKLRAYEAHNGKELVYAYTVTDFSTSETLMRGGTEVAATTEAEAREKLVEFWNNRPPPEPTNKDKEDE